MNETLAPERSVAGAVKRKPGLSNGARFSLVILVSMLTGFGLTLVGILITTQSLRTTLGWLSGAPLAVFASTIFLMLFVLVLALVTRSLFTGGLVVSVLLLLASLVNYYKNLITSTPLQISDFGLIGKMGNIAELNSASITFSRNTIIAVAATVICLIVLLAFSKRLRLPWKRSLPAAGIAAAVFIVMFMVGPVVNAWCYNPLGVELGVTYAQALSNEKCGVPLGLWRSALFSADRYKIFEGELQAVLDDAQNYIGEIDGAGSDTKPNVIMILSESFFDVTKLPGVTYEEDPMADFHRACEEGVSGKFYTRTLGYGTCNIELEILTGINSRFLPSDEMLCYWGGEQFDSLATVPGIFRESGYYTAFLHTFNDSIYNRTPIYTHLGFDDLYFSGDFAAIDPDAAAAEDYWTYMSEKIAGEFYSDDYVADLLIDLYEQKDAECPVFLYAATMENHTPFAADKYADYDYAFSSGLSEEASGVLDALTQGAADSSKALGKLIDYFSECSEPTVIIFFGDHRPGLPLSDGTTVYSELGMCDAVNANWSTETLANLYSTDYVIWSNDAALLPADAGSTADTSSNFLGLDALRAAGMELDPYWRMIASMKESCTIYTWPYFVAADGGIYAALPENMDDGDTRKFEVMTALMRQAFSAGDGGIAFYELEREGK
ncbi:MAG: LTA synthase family protein [Clostridia bacterium]|nr:LTA synthase family protein [Clostridia bacterium]